MCLCGPRSSSIMQSTDSFVFRSQLLFDPSALENSRVRPAHVHRDPAGKSMQENIELVWCGTCCGTCTQLVSLANQPDPAQLSLCSGQLHLPYLPVVDGSPVPISMPPVVPSLREACLCRIYVFRPCRLCQTWRSMFACRAREVAVSVVRAWLLHAVRYTATCDITTPHSHDDIE